MVRNYKMARNYKLAKIHKIAMIHKMVKIDMNMSRKNFSGVFLYIHFQLSCIYRPNMQFAKSKLEAFQE